MISFFRRESDKKLPPLPTHNSHDGRKHNDSISSREHQVYLRDKYNEADLKLSRIEEELDVVLHCARVLRKRRTDLAQNRMKYSESFPFERTLEDPDGFVNRYVALAGKSKALDELIEPLKKECTGTRNECSYLFAKYHEYLKQGFVTFENKQSLEEDTARGEEGRMSMTKFSALDDHGSMDKGSDLERIADKYRTATNVATVVAGLGASLAFTTLFSATRGRLDLIAWAFTCFMMVVVSTALYQNLPPSRIYFSRTMRQWQFINFRLSLALPLVVGICLLMLAVALLDNTSSVPVPGSQIAIRAAGYMPLGWIGAIVVAGYFGLLSRGYPLFSKHHLVPLPTEKASKAEEKMDKMQKHYPSHILPPEHKWTYMPGAPEYAVYRKWRHDNIFSDT